MNKVSYVYLVKIKGHPVFKIGITTNPTMRIRGLQTGSFQKIQPVFCAKCLDSRGVETILHSRFSDCRLEGEWFKLPDSEVHRVIALMRIAEAEYEKIESKRAECEQLVLSAKAKALEDEALEDEALEDEASEFLAAIADDMRADILAALSQGKSDTFVILNILKCPGLKWGKGKKILDIIKQTQWQTQ